MARSRANGLSPEKLREYARAGAQVTLHRLRAEIAAIERAFPEFASHGVRSRSVEQAAGTVRRRSRRMSAAARKAVSQRMKRYWAERRKAKSKAA
jgi:hypothetical protein